MEAAFMGLVRPMLEYAGVVWDPYTANLCSEIEKVQRRAVRFVTSDYYNFEPGTLKQRRTASTLIYFNQVLHSLSALSIDNLPAPTRKTRHMHTKHLMVHFARTNAFKFSFVSRANVAWNSLPQFLIDISDNANAFEDEVKKFQI